MELLLLFWGPLVATLALTLLIGRLTKGRFQGLILLPLGFLAVPLAESVYEWLQGDFFWELGVLLWAIIGGAILLGWLIGWRLCRRKERAVKREVKLYNVLLPIWILYFFPQVWVITLPGNLLIDCGVLLLTLAALKHTQKKEVLKKLWWKFWLLGFLADFVGAVFLFGFWYLSLLPEPFGSWVDGIISQAFLNPFRTLPGFLYTLAGVAIAGVCIYFFDKRAMKSCALLDGRQRHVVALTMAIVTAPWTFLIPLYW